jgi:amino-acid N-acetyltransferase
MEVFYRPPEYSSKQLLAECDLPTSDLKPGHFDSFIGCGAPDNLKGIVGLECFGSVALLRSLAVAEVARGLGCAKALVLEAESYAKGKGVSGLYLLTTTAESFFSKKIRRTRALKNSSGFTQLNYR